MLIPTIASELLVDLSTNEQQLLAGGKSCCDSKSKAKEKPTEETWPTSASFAVGKLITVTPFVKCFNEEETDDEMEGVM
jgi:hypothetical protein